MKELKTLVRALFVEEFGGKIMYATDPVAEYGVVYDQEDEITTRGEKVKVVYGITKHMVPNWKMQANKASHKGVLEMGDAEFMEGNLLAFYWIHKRIFDHQDLTKKEITSIMIRLCDGIKGDNMERNAIDITPAHKAGEGIWDWTIRKTWKKIGINSRPQPFCTMTNVFPADMKGRRAISAAYVRGQINLLIDNVRQQMDAVESWRDKDVMQLIKEASNGDINVSTYRMDNYYAEFLKLNPESKLRSWLYTIYMYEQVNSVEELAQHMGVSPTKAKRLVQRVALKGYSKTEQLDKLLTEAILSAKTKSEVMEISGKPRTTVYRRIKMNKALKFLWDQI